MNKKQRPSKSRKGTSIGIAVCFIAAIIMVGTYTLRSHQEMKRQELAMAEEEKEMQAKEKAQDLEKEAGSGLVINTEENQLAKEEQEEIKNRENDAAQGQGTTASGNSQNSWETSGNQKAVNFSADSKLLWPVDGNVLLNYSMDKTVYFATLDQYKYNPALIISGAEGDQVICGTTGIVKSIDQNAQTGTTVNIDIGNGYELFYGQLKDVPVKTGDYVEAKTVLGYVSQPTKYYSVEGCNVYFEMRKDGQPVNPMDYMAE